MSPSIPEREVEVEEADNQPRGGSRLTKVVGKMLDRFRQIWQRVLGHRINFKLSLREFRPAQSRTSNVNLTSPCTVFQDNPTAKYYKLKLKTFLRHFD